MASRFLSFIAAQLSAPVEKRDDVRVVFSLRTSGGRLLRERDFFAFQSLQQPVNSNA